MGWWALTYLDNDRSLHHLHVLANTNHPAHLWMAWAHYKPAAQRIYRIVRGKRVFCGYKYIWDTPNLVEQTQPLDTFLHSFGPITLAATDHVWYYLYSPALLYDKYCQGPLVHVWPPELHTWTTKAYVGTQLKGVYYTETFTGPGGTHPTWTMANLGLHSTHIWQLEPDPFGLAYRMYAITGDPYDRILYHRIPAFLPTWTPLLTDAQANTLTSSTSGTIAWVATNANFPGYLYALFFTPLGDNGIWCIYSQDYGDTWAAGRIFPGTITYNAGTIMAGIAQGASPYPAGSIIYACLCAGIGATVALYRSLDHGATWTFADNQGAGALTPRLLVDPTDQTTVYIGAMRDLGNLHELWRSEAHGANLLEVDGAHHLGLMIDHFIAELWINPTDQTFLTALEDNHLYVSINYCVNWTDMGNIAQTVKRLALLWENPDRFYLARNVSGTPPPPFSNSHVIFASEDHGATMYGKAGQWAHTPTGHGDSIPYNCGGVCLQGIQLFPPY